MVSEKCDVSELASRQNYIGKFYVNKTGIGKMGEYVSSSTNYQ
jgi:hypothetical protein